MTSLSLDQALTPRPQADGSFAFTVEEGWEQGKATFGGLVVGALARAMLPRVSESAIRQRPLRSLSAEIMGSAAHGACQITSRLLRESKTVSTVSAELHQAGAMQVHAVGVFGDRRAFTDTWRHMPARPFSERWQDLDVLDMDNEFAPRFTQHFEYRSIGPLPFSGQAPQQEVRAFGYVRPRLPVSLRDGAFLCAMADAWWLSAFVVMDTPRPAATLTFSIDIHDDLAGHPLDEPLFHYAETVALTDGYATEVRELWRPDGRLVAVNRQLITIIK